MVAPADEQEGGDPIASQKIPFGLRLSLVATALCFTVAEIYFLSAIFRAQRENAAFSRLASETDAPETSQSFQPPASRSERLRQRNPDCIGWLTIPDTKISYPIMLTPNDPERYLHRAFDGSYSSSGVPFAASACTADSDNLLLYGHNMKNGTMFAGLLKYRSKDYWLSHTTVYLDTLEGQKKYVILAAFDAGLSDSTELSFYSAYAGNLTEESFRAYLSQIQQAALYDTGISAVYGDHLLTLSTCSYQETNGRFVVVAKQDEGRRL